jgi:hypothetical protein
MPLRDALGLLLTTLIRTDRKFRVLLDLWGETNSDLQGALWYGELYKRQADI